MIIIVPINVAISVLIKILLCQNLIRKRYIEVEANYMSYLPIGIENLLNGNAIESTRLEFKSSINYEAIIIQSLLLLMILIT